MAEHIYKKERLEKAIGRILTKWEYAITEYDRIPEPTSLSVRENVGGYFWNPDNEDTHENLANAAMLIAEHLRPRREPWSVIAIEDVIDEILAILDDRSRFPGKKNLNTEWFLEAITEQLLATAKPVVLRCRIDGGVSRSHQRNNWKWELPGPARLGINEVTCSYTHIRYDDNTDDRGSPLWFLEQLDCCECTMEIRVSGKATPRAGRAMALGAWNVLKTAANLCCEAESLEDERPRSDGGYLPSDPFVVIPFDGFTLGPQRSDNEFEFNVRLTDLLRHIPVEGHQEPQWVHHSFSLFAETVRAVVFPDTELRGNHEDMQRTARWCLWRLTECDMMGTSPLALVGYLSIVEFSAAKLLFHDRVDNPVGPSISTQVGLSSDAATILEHLFDRRNHAVHKIDFRVGLDEIRASWRLAKAATLFMMRLATIDSDNIGCSEYSRKGLTSAFESALAPSIYESMWKDEPEQS